MKGGNEMTVKISVDLSYDKKLINKFTHLHIQVCDITLLDCHSDEGRVNITFNVTCINCGESKEPLNWGGTIKFAEKHKKCKEAKNKNSF